MTTPERPRRIGLVGCGEVARYGHLPALRRAERLELVGVCEVASDRLADAPVPAEVARCTSLDDLPDLDALVITSPAGVHAEHVTWAARRGLPVLCEKPIALDEPTAVAMIEQMEAADAALWVGFTYRFSPVARRIRDLVAEGAVGEVRSLRMIYLWDLHGAFEDRQAQTGVNQRRIGRMLEGGPLIDCGVHQIDLARWWLRSDLDVEHARGIWFDDLDGVDAPEHLTAQLSGGGAHILVEVSFAYSHRSPTRLLSFGYEVIGTDGVIRYRREERDFVLVDSAGTHELDWAPEKSFDGMYLDLAAALHGEEHALPTGRDGLAATRLASDATSRAVAAR